MAKKKGAWFKPGDKIVYPGYGVGTVRCFEDRNIGGEDRTFVVLDFNEAENVSVVRVPLDKVEDVGLRPISKPKEVKAAVALLKSGEPEILSSWKDRFADHGDKLAAGDLSSVATVLKALWILNGRKPLSFREKKMYQKTLLLLSSEFAEVQKKSREDAEREILALLEAAGGA